MSASTVRSLNIIASIAVVQVVPCGYARSVLVHALNDGARPRFKRNERGETNQQERRCQRMESARDRHVRDFGVPATLEHELFRSVTLRPRLSVGFALSLSCMKLRSEQSSRAQVCHMLPRSVSRSASLRNDIDDERFS